MGNKVVNPYLLVALTSAISTSLSAQTSLKEYLPEDIHAQYAESQKTEVWSPLPPIVSVNEQGVPSDAIVLLGANTSSLDAWEPVKSDTVEWLLEDGVMTVKPGSGDIQTKQDFCSVQLHLEWRAPADSQGKKDQLKNNSGVFLQNRYEVQILDSYNNQTYVNGQAASVYKQTPPLVNAMRPSGEWQSYDIIFSAPVFDDFGAFVEHGRVTVMHNGVLVQNHTKILGTTEWIGPGKIAAHGCDAIKLQDHGDKVSFRNIWVRPLP